MVYVLEGTSVSSPRMRRALQEALAPARPGAFSYLSSHGALDVEHIDDFEQLVNRLERRRRPRQPSLRDAKIFFRLYGNVFRSIEIEEHA